MYPVVSDSHLERVRSDKWVLSVLPLINLLLILRVSLIQPFRYNSGRVHDSGNLCPQISLLGLEEEWISDNLMLKLARKVHLGVPCSLYVTGSEVGELCPRLQRRVCRPVHKCVDASATGFSVGFATLVTLSCCGFQLALSYIIISLGAQDLAPEADVGCA